MKPIDPRRWARPGDLLRATQAFITDAGKIYPGDLALVVKVGPPSVEFIGWLDLKILVEGRMRSVQTSHSCWEHVDEAG